ncbi:MAG: hypothetical protein JWP34_4346 [Massilia sp.]|nr:hypothetical protein [Massilia sp.]
MGMANGTAIGPMRDAESTLSGKSASPSRVVEEEGDASSDSQKAVLSSIQ